MKRALCAVLAVVCGGMISAKEFTGSDLILKGNARMENGVVKLDGQTGFIELAGTEKWNIGKQGLSLAASFKMNDTARNNRNADSFDMFFSKAKTPFIFGRYGGQLYVNIQDAAKNNKMQSPCYAAFKSEAGVWYHLAVVFEYYNDVAQGDIGYNVIMYLNGNRVGSAKCRFLEPVQGTSRLDVGKGWGGVWFLNGEVAEINAVQRVMNEAEIAELVDKSKYVKVKSARKVNPALKGIKAASPAGNWALNALHRLEPVRGTAAAGKLAAAFRAGSDAAFLKAFNPKCGAALIVKPQVLILADTQKGSGEPLLGVYDRIGRKAVLEDKLMSWNCMGIVGKKKIQIDSSDLPYTIRNFSNKGFTAVWQAEKPVKFTAEARYDFLDDGIGMSLKINNQTPVFILKTVVFPETRTARLGEDDAFLYPYQCGVEIKNPTRNNFKFGQHGRYPGASMTMQFTAYYGGGRGVFLGWQDKIGTIKNMDAVGKRNGMEFFWTQSVAIPLNQQNGGNHYASPGRVVFRVYSGRWFEACMLHKAWAVSEPVWKVTLPKVDTPEWFRNLPVTFNYSVTAYDTAMTRYAQLMFMRKYLDVPIYVSSYAWSDDALGGWPYFRPRKFIPAFFKDIQKGGCYVEPYIDSRLWDTMDGPNHKSVWRYEKLGKKFAVIGEDGKIPMEYYYGGAHVYAVMCPYVKGWQDELFDLTKYVATLGNSIYHDQVMTAQGFCCMNKEHGHALNDPSVWLNQGYRPLYLRIRKALPGMVHSSEEVSEPYMDLFDAGHIWRWYFDGQVPAFQAVYGGRMQYQGLVYDDHGKGEYASNFVKMGNSLVNGLKLGKINLNAMYHPDAKRLFLKKMVHLRLALNDYFNNGDMLAPIQFAKPVPLMTTGWSTNSKALEPVTMPKIVSNSYAWNKHSVYIFVNTTAETLACEPRIPADYLCVEGAAAPVKFAGRIQLGAYQSAIAVKGSLAEAKRFQTTLKKIASFTPGDSYDRLVRFKEHRKIKLAPGEFAGMDKVSGYYNCSKSVSGTHFGGMVDGSLISYGEVDFGTNKVTEITFKLAVPDSYEGGTFTLLTGPNQNVSQVVGVCKVPGTGSWKDFKDVKFKLKKPLTGKCNIVIRADRHACGNFAGWKY